jgi:hypothetical protein
MEAEILSRKLLRIRKKIYGTNDNATVVSKINLSNILH